ncbi:hypothetical protein U3450_003885 [Bacillus cytotoxicus]|nr:hypothetical protein [Bacillus cytotoxicus]
MTILLSANPMVEKHLKLALQNNVNFTYNDHTFVNLKELYIFIRDNVADTVDFEEVMKEVIETAMEKGGPNCSYELGSHETKVVTLKQLVLNTTSNMTKKKTNQLIIQLHFNRWYHERNQ